MLLRVLSHRPALRLVKSGKIIASNLIYEDSSSMPNLTINGTEFYGAPKNGGTTVRMWAKQFEAGLRADDLVQDGYYTLERIGLPSLWRDLSGNPDMRFFEPNETRNIKWCIKREPIERFISGYTDKVLRERLANWSIDECINLLESREIENIVRQKKVGWFAAIHLFPQCAWLGKNTSYYDKVFDISEMDAVRKFCESQVFKIPLANLHARNLSKVGVRKISLSSDQRSRIRNIYHEDYAAGWC